METIIKIEHPFTKLPQAKKGDLAYMLLKKQPLFRRLRQSICAICKFRMQEMGGSRINTSYSVEMLGWRVMTIDRNEYHDRSDKERADEYLNKWSACEREVRKLRLIVLGDEVPDPETRKLLRDSLGVDLEEGRLM